MKKIYSVYEKIYSVYEKNSKYVYMKKIYSVYEKIYSAYEKNSKYVYMKKYIVHMKKTANMCIWQKKKRKERKTYINLNSQAKVKGVKKNYVLEKLGNQKKGVPVN